MSNQSNSYTHHSQKNFTMIQNHLIRTPTLSCKAYKLLSIGLSHDGRWIFKKTQIATCFKEGMHTVDEAMRELRSLGYLHLKAKKGEEHKFIGHSWFWFEDPLSEEEFKLFFREGGFQGLGEIGSSETPPDIRRPSSKNTNVEEKNNNSAVVFPCLKDLDIAQHEKEWITKKHRDRESDVIHAVKWIATADIKESFIQALKWACNNHPEINSTPDQRSAINKKITNEIIERVKDNPSKVSVYILNKYIELVVCGKNQPYIVNYDEKGFERKLHEALMKCKITLHPG